VEGRAGEVRVGWGGERGGAVEGWVGAVLDRMGW